MSGGKLRAAYTECVAPFAHLALMPARLLLLVILLGAALPSHAQRATARQPSNSSTAKRLQTRPPNPIDTLLDVGGHRLHFHVLKGHGPIILFESGGGDDWTEWQPILAPLYQATGATLVTYDRAGFGSSELDSTQTSLSQQISSLKTGLAKLHLDQQCVLVAHSFGGYFATLFAATYPAQVQGVVFVDATQVAFWTDAQVNGFLTEYAPVKEQVRRTAPGRYWMYVDMPTITQQMRQTRFPPRVPAVLLLAEHSPFATADETRRWRQAQRQFVAQAPNRRLVLAIGSGHYIMRDKPALVVSTIARLYRASQPKQ